MKVAVPLFGSRVAPRCVIARQIVLVTVENGGLRGRETTGFAIADEADLVDKLVELGVNLLVCGGIRKEIEEELSANGIQVVNNVAGEAEEVLAALTDGGLFPGHGFRERARRDPRVREGKPPPSVDCLLCPERTCAEGGGCSRDLGAWSHPWLRGEEARIYEVGQDISAETDPKLCRIAELVHFCIGTGYRRIGLAFCWELYREVDVLVPVLRRFFTVRPVCCRVGSRSGDGSAGTCNPVALARLLNREETDLNVAAGLCIGCDMIFTRRSRAPVTTLFVKDRSLAHNPVGAIYTRYHLKDLTGEGGPFSPSRSGRI